MGNIVVVLIVFIGIVSWIVNFARQSEMQQKQKERRQRRGRSPMAVDDFIDDSEIEVVQPGRRDTQNKSRSRDDVWREQSGRNRPQPQRQAASQPARAQRAAPQRKKQSPAPVPAPTPEATRLADRHMQSSVGAHVDRDVPHTIGAAVTRDLGTSNSGEQATLETTGRRDTPASLLRKALATSQGVRTAMMFSEILGPPLARRDR